MPRTYQFGMEGLFFKKIQEDLTLDQALTL